MIFDNLVVKVDGIFAGARFVGRTKVCLMDQVLAVRKFLVSVKMNDQIVTGSVVTA